MKRLFCIAAVATLLASCTTNNYTITGAIENAGDSVYLLTVDTKAVITSAAADESGAFTINGTLEKPEIALLANGDQEPLSLIFIEKGDINVALENGFYTIAGTPTNDAYTAFNKTMSEKQMAFFSAASPEEQESIYKEVDSIYISAIKNNRNLFGVYLLASNNHRLEDAETLEVIEALPAELQQNSFITDIKELIENKANTEVGKNYVDLNLQDVNGNMIKLSDLINDGKWVLIDFWATWCSPCKAQIPYVLEAYNEFKDKGFVVYAVSLDNNAEAWKAYIEEKGLNWVNVWGRLDEASNEQVMKYAVQTIPSNFLISPEGVIVAKNLHSEGVIETLQEHIK